MPSTDPASLSRRPRPAHDEDDELGLPPLDGALDEHGPPLEADDGDAFVEEAGGDDSVASDLDPGWTIDEIDDVGPDDTGAARDAVDIGSIADAIALPDDGGHVLDERGLARDHEDDSPFDAMFDADAGAGTGEDPSSFVDEAALPPLDMDDEGAGPADGPGHDLAVPEPALPWDRGRFRIAAGLGAEVPCSLVAVSPAGAVAAGPALLIVREGARVPSGMGPDIDVVAVAASDEAIFAVARRGALFASMDGGDSWVAGGAPWPAARGPSSIAATPGRLWVCEGGALWSVRWERKGRPGPPVQVRPEGVRSIVAAGSTLVVLCERGGELAVERLRGDDEAHPAEVVPARTRAAIGDAAPALSATAGGRVVGILAGGAVLLSRDAGRTFRRFEAGRVLALAFAGSGEDARVVVLGAGPERGRDAGLFLAEGGDEGGFARVAAIEAPRVQAASLAWDAAREVLWVACASGLLAFERSTQH